MIEANDAFIFIFMAGAYVLLPALLAKFIIRVTWMQVILAFPVFWLVLFVILGFGRINEEVFGWTLIMAMFTSWLGVPLAALLLKVANLPYRLLSRN